MKRTLIIAAFAALGMAAPPLAAQAPQAPAVQPAEELTNAELQSFVVALLEVHKINNTWLPIYQAAGSPEEQKRIEREATDEMVRAVQDSGMTVERYQVILHQAQNDPAVADRISEIVKQGSAAGPQ